MSVEQLCIDYLAALDAGDIDALGRLFTEDAVVVSPLYGARPAKAFYVDLFNDTSRSDTRLLNVFDSSANSRSVALHFVYSWTLSSGERVRFECVDVFQLSGAGNRFSKLTIIYDTAVVRDVWRDATQALRLSDG